MEKKRRAAIHGNNLSWEIGGTGDHQLASWAMRITPQALTGKPSSKSASDRSYGRLEQVNTIVEPQKAGYFVPDQHLQSVPL